MTQLGHVVFYVRDLATSMRLLKIVIANEVKYGAGYL